MSSLWTPGGEHEVPREPSPRPDTGTGGPGQAPAGPPPGASPEDLSAMPGYDELTPEQREQAEAMARELAEARQRIAEVPAAEVVANHVMGLYELAAIHLTAEPAALAEAQLAIDAMAAVLQALPGRLGVNEATLREALGQLQVAFVQVKEAGTGSADDREDESGAGSG